MATAAWPRLPDRLQGSRGYRRDDEREAIAHRRGYRHCVRCSLCQIRYRDSGD